MWESQILNLIESQGCLGFIYSSVTSSSLILTITLWNATKQVIRNPDYNDWMWTDKLIKGWIIGTLREEIFQEVVSLKSMAGVWSVLNNTFNKSTIDRELFLHHQLKMLCRENCASLNDFLERYKSIYVELSVIGKPLPEDHNSFWMLNCPGSNYPVFTTLTFTTTPLPKYSELLFMRWILIPESASSSQQVAYISKKGSKKKQFPKKFTSENCGFMILHRLA